MPRPTIKAITRKPRAVVNLAWLLVEIQDDHDQMPADYDFEWFNNEDAMKEYYLYCRDYNESDFADHGDIALLTAEVTDTTKMTLGRVHVSPHTAYMKVWKKRVEDDPSLLIYKTRPEQEAVEEELKAPTRGRAKSPAAQAAAKKTAAKAPAAKKEAAKRQVRKPAAKQAAPAKKTATKKAAETDPDGKKAALQKRLAAKKTPATEGA